MFDLDPASLDRAEELARRAVDLDPSVPIAQATLGIVSIWRGQPERARPRLERARELAPNEPGPHIFLSLVELQSGDPLEALVSFRTGMRLNPRAGSSGAGSMLLAQIYARTGRLEEAEALWRRARAENPDLIVGRLWLAVHLEETGRRGEAREVLAEALAVNPEISVEAVRRHGLFARLPNADAFLAGLRAAGLP
jgi:tetratricopeptide (TPR) repeat protein